MVCVAPIVCVATMVCVAPIVCVACCWPKPPPNPEAAPLNMDSFGFAWPPCAAPKGLELPDWKPSPPPPKPERDFPLAAPKPEALGLAEAWSIPVEAAEVGWVPEEKAPVEVAPPNPAPGIEGTCSGFALYFACNFLKHKAS
eukprot:scaffold7350_cov233-Pinguiococcus_pyrenoidosus.AAC.8